MMGTINCIYETPCGWCSKWDKKCDRKIPERGQRVKCNPVDGVMDSDLTKATKLCKSESDHDWVCTSISTNGIHYACRKCNEHKIYPIEYNELSVTI